MNDDADIFVIAGIISLAFALAVVALLGFTNVWIAGITLLGLPAVTLVLTVAIGKAIIGRRAAVMEAKKKRLTERAELPARSFARAWLAKGRVVRMEPGEGLLYGPSGLRQEPT
ncbi:MAG: hypothetical protein HYX92_08095 [Chloroflexi bacterium]|nr:hypothetical protein [Chloroflexota bacterium]